MPESCLVEWPRSVGCGASLGGTVAPVSAVEHLRIERLVELNCPLTELIILPVIKIILPESCLVEWLGSDGCGASVGCRASLGGTVAPVGAVEHLRIEFLVELNCPLTELIILTVVKIILPEFCLVERSSFFDRGGQSGRCKGVNFLLDYEIWERFGSHQGGHESQKDCSKFLHLTQKRYLN